MAGAKTEQVWINAWNEVFDLIGERPLHEVVCILAGGDECSVESCQDWIQSSAYEGYAIQVSEVWHKGKKVIKATRKSKG